uniref:Uncharacterized protein n=1 Tax=Octopus bimaculoides TaxID=37653 RepID=A0A0L8HSK4_OCTBM
MSCEIDYIHTPTICRILGNQMGQQLIIAFNNRKSNTTELTRKLHRTQKKIIQNIKETIEQNNLFFYHK